MAGGQEVVGAAADHVEAERAAVLPAVDGVAGRQQRGEHTGRALNADGTRVTAGAALDDGDPGRGDAAVGGDHQPVGGRVDVPGDAFDAGALHRVAQCGELAGAVPLRGGCAANAGGAQAGWPACRS